MEPNKQSTCAENIAASSDVNDANSDKLSEHEKSKNKRPAIDLNELNKESLGQHLSLSTNLHAQPGDPGVVGSSSPSQIGQSSHTLPKPAKDSIPMSSENAKSKDHKPRLARLPAEGRGRCHLLPRYWPKITDTELKKLSGEYPLIILYFDLFLFFLS